jgi:hypothetical protein
MTRRYRRLIDTLSRAVSHDTPRSHHQRTSQEFPTSFHCAVLKDPPGH